MTEATTPKEQENAAGSFKRIIVFEVIAIFFFTLSLAASIAIILRPLEVLPRGAYAGNAARTLWLLFALGFFFGIVLHTLGAPSYSRRNLSGRGGIVNLVLGFASAVEIFLLKIYKPDETLGITSLWWLFVILTILGTLGVYLPARAKRLEAEEEKRKAEEARRQALAKEWKRRPRIIRLKVRHYYICEKKIFDCKD